MKKKEFKKNIIENIEMIDVFDNINEYSINKEYGIIDEQKIYRKKFNIKLVYICCCFIIICFLGCIIIPNSGFDIFEDMLQPEAGEATNENPKEENKNQEYYDNLNEFKEYYKTLGDNKLNDEMLENIFEEFRYNRSLEEVISAYQLEQSQEIITNLYNYYQQNINENK